MKSALPTTQPTGPGGIGTTTSETRRGHITLHGRIEVKVLLEVEVPAEATDLEALVQAAGAAGLKVIGDAWDLDTLATARAIDDDLRRFPAVLAVEVVQQITGYPPVLLVKHGWEEIEKLEDGG